MDALGEFQRGAAIVGDSGVEAGEAQQLRQGIGGIDVVVDDQQALGVGAADRRRHGGRRRAGERWRRAGCRDDDSCFGVGVRLDGRR